MPRTITRRLNASSTAAAAAAAAKAAALRLQKDHITSPKISTTRILKFKFSVDQTYLKIPLIMRFKNITRSAGKKRGKQSKQSKKGKQRKKGNRKKSQKNK